MARRTLLVAVHGICTSQTDPSWPDKLDAWASAAAPWLRVLKKEYSAGLTPRFNVFVRDPKLARGIVAEVEEFLAGPDHVDVWFLCHSNGCVVGLQAVRLLVAAGHDVAGLVFVGGAVESDVVKNGVRKMVHGTAYEGRLDRAVAFSNSGDDTVPHYARPGAGWWERLKLWVWRRLAWPYGGLGNEGWTLAGRPVELPSITTVPYPPGTGHSGYWRDAERTKTFARVVNLIQSKGL